MVNPNEEVRADLVLDANQPYAIIDGKRVPVRFDPEELKVAASESIWHGRCIMQHQIGFSTGQKSQIEIETERISQHDQH